MKRNRIFLMVTVLALAFALAAFAQAGRMGGQGTRGGGASLQQQAAGPGFGSPQWIAKYLELSEAQIEQWKVIQEETRAAMAPILETRKANGERLRELLEGTNPDPTTVGTLVIQNHTLGAQIRDIHEAAQAKFIAILTPEQKTKFEAFLEFMKNLPRRGPGGEGSGFGSMGFGPGPGDCPWCD